VDGLNGRVLHHSPEWQSPNAESRRNPSSQRLFCDSTTKCKNLGPIAHGDLKAVTPHNDQVQETGVRSPMATWRLSRRFGVGDASSPAPPFSVKPPCPSCLRVEDEGPVQGVAPVAPPCAAGGDATETRW